MYIAMGKKKSHQYEIKAIIFMVKYQYMCTCISCAANQRTIKVNVLNRGFIVDYKPKGEIHIFYFLLTVLNDLLGQIL